MHRYLPEENKRPEYGFPACAGLLSLPRRHGKERLETPHAGPADWRLPVLPRARVSELDQIVLGS